MISFDLKCGHHHVFEVWFRSSADYETQWGGGLLLCPTCGDDRIEKAVMAPAVAAKGNQRTSSRTDLAMPEGAGAIPVMSEADAERIGALMTALAQAQSEMIGQSEWVGERFADKARAMHYGETESRLIHGTANARETREMLEEGLPVAPLLIPIAPPDQVN
ncbi:MULTISPECIES: DUF1178 family protein [unclassified Sphingobium]|uniref:DUF1178 family protein n=1 Tax=unclassified Sphingobium TaxID=2611147 RepID=UPI002224655D|nr:MULTISPECIES: DUF1178 family protein [unclassified Sphingobium]MCW2415561.1 hypothetical protein [Sphingobium sp. B8D3A]